MAFDKDLLKKLAKSVGNEAKEVAKRSANDRQKNREEILSVVHPVLKEISEASRLNKSDLIEVARNIKVETPKMTINPTADVKIPAIQLPVINVPKPHVTVNVPEIKSPEVIMPSKMSVGGEVSLSGVDEKHGLPIVLKDKFGNNVDLASIMKAASGTAGGGKADFHTIKNIQESAWGDLLTGDDRIKVELPTGSSGLTDTELRASSVPVEQVSGSLWSTNVVDAFGSTAVTNVWNADNRLKVSVETGGGGLTDAELRATSVPVSQVSGAIFSTEVTNTVLVRPVQVRGSLQTAYVTASSEGEKVLLVGASGVFHDLVMMKGSNESDAAITLDIRQTTGGTIQDTLVIPATGTAGVALAVPIPQDHADATWTVDNNSADASNTIYSITALFSIEV